MLLLLPVNGWAMDALPMSSSNPTGWHWYNERTEKKLIKHQSVRQKTTRDTSAILQMNRFNQLAKNALDQAVLNPTEENLRNYIILQNVIAENASEFSNMWQKVLLEYPSLDYAVKFPTENNAQSVLYEQENQRELSAIHLLAKNNGLFFFYRGNHALDQSLAPVIFDFAHLYHIALIPISVDHHILPLFNQASGGDIQSSQWDQGQAKKMGIDTFPALVLVNPKTQIYQAIHYGYISQDELKHRFLQIATNFSRNY